MTTHGLGTIDDYHDAIESEEQKRQEEFFLDQDNSSHWYVVPASKHDEWWAWLKLDSEDERSWESPEWATRINGGPCDILFKEWRGGE
jgi:hypothetical protein